MTECFIHASTSIEAYLRESGWERVFVEAPDGERKPRYRKGDLVLSQKAAFLHESEDSGAWVQQEESLKAIWPEKIPAIPGSITKFAVNLWADSRHVGFARLKEQGIDLLANRSVLRSMETLDDVMAVARTVLECGLNIMIPVGDPLIIWVDYRKFTQR